MSQEQSIEDIRREKLAKLRDLGYDPYQVERFPYQYSAKQLLDQFDTLAPSEDIEDKLPYVLPFAGRLVSMRIMGKAAFAHISDGDDKVQAYFRKNDLPEPLWDVFMLLDIGDHIGVEGYLFTTRTGEKSLHVSNLTPLSKAIHVLPLGKSQDTEDGEAKSWYGLSDIDTRYRHRHLDLVCNPEARKMLLDRSRIVTAVRHFFDREGFYEVETPMLQLEAGGAAARPFLTHYNAYEMDVKLRISLELYLKRLICGDLKKVYEIGRVFRNEGVSNRHNPEFTLLEWYEAFANLEDTMERVEKLFASVAQEVYGTTTVQGIDFSQPWKRLQLMDGIEQLAGVSRDELTNLEAAKKALDRVGIPSEDENNLGGIIEKLLERFVEPTLQEPTFVIGYPIETSPLAKKDLDRPGFTRRFEGYLLGREICNAFSEINDPADQRERFESQLSQRASGNDEAHPMDEDYIYALESGMPPTGGCGIGIDRLVMLLTGADHLREILLFPMMKPAE